VRKPSVPNKPMVPTASASPVRYPTRSLRRHIGQPLGGAQGGIAEVGQGFR
jgi:hypothetical protein